MSQLVIDMMGSDRGSAMSKEAVRLFHQDHPDCALVLVGKKEELQDMAGYRIIDAQDTVKMEMGALEVLRMKESSMVKAVQAVIDNKADGVVSAGSTGAFLSAAALLLKKIPGVSRPALVTSFPNLKEGGFATILDVGASNANTPEELAQFGLMGSIYAQKVNGIATPRVALLSNGSEAGKGSPEGKEAYHLLEKDNRLHFVGNVEGNQILQGAADVIVTDGYSGNVMLKSIEGTAKGMSQMLKKAFKRNLFSKIGYLLSKKGIAEMRNVFDSKKVGGALLLGVNGVVVKAHGNSDPEAFKNAMEVAYRLAEAHVVDALKAGFAS
jgi:glycerol-3-phosphate acyltransferase PlsX